MNHNKYIDMVEWEYWSIPKAKSHLTSQLKWRCSTWILSFWLGRRYRFQTIWYYFLLDKGVISWSSVRQPILSLSSTKAQYKLVCVATCEVVWLKRVLNGYWHDDEECNISLMWYSKLYYTMMNPIFHSRTKHVDIQYHYIECWLKMRL